jgi:hypothetical protein
MLAISLASAAAISVSGSVSLLSYGATVLQRQPKNFSTVTVRSVTWVTQRGCRSLPLTSLGRQPGQAVRARVALTG